MQMKLYLKIIITVPVFRKIIRNYVYLNTGLTLILMGKVFVRKWIKRFIARKLN